MDVLKVNVVNNSKNNLPEYSTVGAAGMDLRAHLKDNVVLKPMERALIPTGLYIELAQGYEAQVRPRSGLALKHGISVLNTPGTIDCDYRGEIGVILVNLSNTPFVVRNGERIAQMVVAQYSTVALIPVNSLDDPNTERGDGGFGHTGNS